MQPQYSANFKGCSGVFAGRPFITYLILFFYTAYGIIKNRYRYLKGVVK